MDKNYIIDALKLGNDRIKDAKEWRRARSQQIGEMLRSERESNAVSLRLMAKKMGCSAVYLGELETGKKIWTPEKVESFFKHLPLA